MEPTSATLHEVPADSKHAPPDPDDLGSLSLTLTKTPGDRAQSTQNRVTFKSGGSKRVKSVGRSGAVTTAAVNGHVSKFFSEFQTAEIKKMHQWALQAEKRADDK